MKKILSRQGEPLSTGIEGISIRSSQNFKKKQDIVVLEKDCGVIVIRGIKATAIILKNTIEPYDGFIWPIKKFKRSKPENIIVYFNKETLETGYKISDEALEFKKNLPSDVEVEFEYFQPKKK